MSDEREEGGADLPEGGEPREGGEGASHAESGRRVRRVPPPEIVHFVETLQGRKPRATVVLAVSIVGIYALGALWGAPDLPPALYRMGALSPAAVRDGEVWRLVSSAFLHGSLVHLAANTYVLWSLGSLERIVGTARFVLLYALAAVGGAALSFGFLGDGVSVGASGAIWGLMTALFALTLRPGLLPEDYRLRLRSGLFQSLFINVAISLAPGVDWAAHAGGGLVGLALGLSGALTAGMPRWGVPMTAPLEDRVPAYVRLGAPVAATVLAAGVVTAIALGRPWELDADPVLARVPLADTGATVLVPEGLAPQPPDPGAEPGEHVFGDLREDMGRVSVEIIAAPDARAADAAAMYTETEAQLATADPAPLPGSVARPTVDGREVLVATWRYGEILDERAFYVRDGDIVRVDVFRWNEAPTGWEGVAGRVAAGVE